MSSTLVVMLRPDPSRHCKVRPGDEVLDSVGLPGWEEQSVWGWDSGTGTFFAQLWHNDSVSEAPDIAIVAGPRTVYPWPSCVALAVVERVEGMDPLTVVRAMGLADPDPQLRADEEIAELIEQARADGRTRCVEGQVHALTWTLGRADRSPGSRLTWCGGRPTAAQVDAEHHMATGGLYRAVGRDREALSGVDMALWQALGRRYT